MNRIGVLTSGGDAPGMNAAIRAVVRAGSEKEMVMFGVKHGYAGLLSGDIIRLRARDVGGVIQHGGTFLGSARSEEFKTRAGREKALRNLKEHRIEALVIIGGNGSQTGAFELHEMGFPVVGVASTIDNDLFGSDITIGVDTALNIAIEAIDRLKVTATSHQRAFLVEVMGRKCGYLALMSAIAGGAESVVIPEVETEAEQVASTILDAYRRGKNHALVVVAEGASQNVESLVRHFKQNQDRLGFDIRTTILGHVQRGGIPTASDRILAARLGTGAVDCLAANTDGVLVGMSKGEVTHTPLVDVAGKKKPIDLKLLQMSRVLAT